LTLLKKKQFVKFIKSKSMIREGFASLKKSKILKKTAARRKAAKTSAPSK
jgi:hypothetical protein